MVKADYGCCKEILILKATALGLGMCWLGGTFQVDGFAQAVALCEDEILPTVSPIGYPAEERSITEKIMRRVAGSDHRKPWSDLFFTNNFSKPMPNSMPENIAMHWKIYIWLLPHPTSSHGGFCLILVKILTTSIFHALLVTIYYKEFPCKISI